MAYHGSGAHTPINYEEEEAGHRLQDVPSNVSFLPDYICLLCFILIVFSTVERKKKRPMACSPTNPVPSMTLTIVACPPHRDPRQDTV